jgi:DNA polymerase III subunit delta
MVAIPIGEADDFLARPFGRTSVILLFGPDRGLVSERSQLASRTFLGGENAPGQKIQLLGDAIASDPLLLVDEANSIDMFQSSNRCILVSVGGKSVLPALDMIARAPPQNCLIVMEAGELRRDAPLRKWAETQDIAAAIECRPDDARSLMRLIEREFAAAGCAIEPSARDALLGVLGEDRIATRNEIEKLLLFTSGQGTVHCSDVEAICYDPNLTQTDAIVDGVFSSDRQTLLERLISVSLSGADPMVVLMAMMRHALALQRGVGAVDAGANPADALQSMLRSTGGFNRKAEFMRQMKSANARDLLGFVRALQNFTKATRENSTLSSQRLTRLLISRAGGRRDGSR